MIAGLAERAQTPSATLSLGPISQGRGDVAVAGRQGRRVGCGRAGVHTPPPGANPPLINSFGTLPGVQGTGIGHDVAGLCRAGIRGLPRVRASRAWIPARALWRLPCRAPVSVQRQTPGLLPELRHPTHGREWGVARGRRRVAQNILVLMLDAGLNMRRIGRDRNRGAAAPFGLAILILTARRRATGHRDPRAHGGATFCRIDPTPVFS